MPGRRNSGGPGYLWKALRPVMPVTSTGFQMIELRLFDPNRHPSSWTEIIGPGQYAAFSKRRETGAPCDRGGQLFATVEDATCLLFDRLETARTFCEEQVLRAADVQFEIFDSSGRGGMVPCWSSCTRPEPRHSRGTRAASASARGRPRRFWSRQRCCSGTTTGTTRACWCSRHCSESIWSSLRHGSFSSTDRTPMPHVLASGAYPNTCAQKRIAAGADDPRAGCTARYLIPASVP